MVIKHGDKTERPSWDHPEELEAFLAVIGSSLDDPREAALKVDIFMHGYDAQRMPEGLRRQLIQHGLLNPRARYR
jgi:hypothetical protein